jgi:glutamate-1-semialdehyde aminotransferase
MVRFSRTGGEACAIAIRIARAASGKDKVAFCGYHGWHDWYLSSNIADEKNLNGSLLPGLEPAGVPRGLKGTTIPFSYGKADELDSIVSDNDIGVIIMEVERHKKLNLDFLNYVKKTAKKIGAVLIFDEVSSGFRLRAGGIHMLHDISPDMVVLGKAMGNGFPITAIVGKKEVMEHAQDTFISSTFWTERIGYAAALKVIEIFNRDNVSNHLIETGNYLKNQLQNLFQGKGFNAEVVGLPPVPTVIIKEESPLAVKTYFTQEMLKKGYLASTLTYISYAHSRKVINDFIVAAEEVIKETVKGIRENRIEEMLEGPICHSGFKRLI